MEGEFVYADLKSVGDFQCSNELWNRFEGLLLWCEELLAT